MAIKTLFKKIRFASWAVLGLVLALAWGEVFTRILLPQNRDTVLDILVPDPQVGYIYRPGATIRERGRDYDVPFAINNLGLRDREIGANQGDRIRIMLVGNSFSVSHGVDIENSLSRALEREFNARTSAHAGLPAVEVVNCSNAGYNSLNYWRAYSRWAPILHPDIVAVGFVAAREYKCDTEDTRFIVQDGLLMGRYSGDGPPPAIKADPLMGIRKGLARNSDLYVLLRNFLYYNDRVDRLLRREPEGTTALKDLEPYLAKLPPKVAKGWDLAFSHLEKLNRDTEQDGVRLVVLGIPEKTEVDDGYFKRLAAGAGLDAAALRRDQPLLLLEAFCRDRGIPLVNCKAAIAEAHRERATFFEFDNHWNAHGIAVGAASLIDQWELAPLPPFDVPDGLPAGGGDRDDAFR